MRKSRLLRLLIFFLMFCFSSRLLSQDLGNQVFSDKEIKSSGLVYLSDLFSLTNNWKTSTIDGFTWFASANNLATFQKQNFLVFLDKDQIYFNLFNVPNLNALPITLAQVDSVRIIDVPQIYNGEFVDNGAVNIYTRLPKKSLSVFANYTVGDESGDPDLFAYIDSSYRNVDKIGPNTSFGLSYSLAKTSFQFSMNRKDFFATDSLIYNRIYKQCQSYPKFSLWSAFGKLRTELFGSKQNFTFGYTRQFDFYFFSPLSIELPLAKDIYLLNWNSEVAIERFVLKPRVNYSKNKVSSWKIRKVPFPDWTQEVLICNFEIESKGNDFSFNAGSGINFFRMRDDLYNTSAKSSFLKFYSSYNIKLENGLSPRFDLYVSLKEKKFYGKFASSFLWQINDYQTIETSISYSENPYIDERNYWFWRNKDIFIYAIDENLEKLLSEKQKMTTLDLVYTPFRFNKLKLSLGGSYRFFNNYYIDDQQFFYNSELEDFHSIIKWSESNFGKVISGKVNLVFEILKTVTSKIDYLYQKVIGGEHNFKNAWEVIPNHSLNCVIIYDMNQNFSIQASLRYTSSSNWINYLNIEEMSGGKYSSKLKPKTLIDVSIQKWLWNKHIWLNLVIKNILKQKEIYHPIGADLGLRFFFQANIYLDSVL